MRDDKETKIWVAHGPGQESRQLFEVVSGQDDRRYAVLFQLDCGVDTPRGTGASVAAAGEHPVAAARELLLFEDEFPRNGIRGKFGIQDSESPFKDERVRQAFSMLMDRQLLIDTLQNVDELRASGLPLETRWNSSMWCGWEGAWLDP